MIICLILELLIKFYYFLEHYIISSFRFNFSYTELILDRCNIIYPLEIFVTNNVGELNSSNEEIENQEFNYDISISRQVFIHLYSIPNYLEELIDILRYTLSKNLVSMSGYSNEDVNIEDIFNYITNIAANTLVYGSMNSKQNLLVFLRNYFRDFSNGNKITFSDISNHFRCLSDELFFIDRIKPIKRNNLKNTITNLIIGLITSLIGGIVITYGGIVLTYLSNI
ncbi:MAG TPA: hypothetical protein PLQ02_00760 [Methanofastidiosum sp.]|nr:hypothetical protein [Methanofastidiosum sp.]